MKVLPAVGCVLALYAVDLLLIVAALTLLPALVLEVVSNGGAYADFPYTARFVLR